MRHPHLALLLSVIAAGLSPVSSRGAGAPDLDTLTAQQAAADLCAGKYASTALVSAAIARAKANLDLNAFITLDEAGAMKAAAAFDSGRKKKSAAVGSTLLTKRRKGAAKREAAARAKSRNRRPAKAAMAQLRRHLNRSKPISSDDWTPTHA